MQTSSLLCCSATHKLQTSSLVDIELDVMLAAVSWEPIELCISQCLGAVSSPACSSPSGTAGPESCIRGQLHLAICKLLTKCFGSGRVTLIDWALRVLNHASPHIFTPSLAPLSEISWAAMQLLAAVLNLYQVHFFTDLFLLFACVYI